MAEQIEKGENVEEIAEPQEQEVEVIEEETSEDMPEVAEPAPQRDFEKDSAFAEMRRKAEDAERRASKADQWAKENYGHLGIETWDQYQQELEVQKKREEYAENGIDYDEVRKIAKEEAANHPDVLSAQQIQQRESVNAEIRNLKSVYPHLEISEVSDVRDLVSTLEKLPNWEEIKKRVTKGYELIDAYELANKDEIIGKRTAAAAQAARNAAKSKDHLKPSGNQAADDGIVIDQQEMAMFKSLFPKMKESDFYDWKRKQLKKG